MRRDSSKLWTEMTAIHEACNSDDDAFVASDDSSDGAQERPARLLDDSSDGETGSIEAARQHYARIQAELDGDDEVIDVVDPSPATPPKRRFRKAVTSHKRRQRNTRTRKRLVKTSVKKKRKRNQGTCPAR